MRVFLIPTGISHYQLYVEVPREAEVPSSDTAPPRGWLGRKIQKFKDTLAEAEEERLRRERGETGPRTLAKRIMGKIAEAVAEQRLLWQLRNRDSATLYFPDDITESAALELMRAELSRDLSKHVRWLVIDALLVLITGPLFFFVPGPNVVSWYFTFRAAGHFLSWRGARNGLWNLVWTATADGRLTSVRRALTLPSRERCHELDEIARSLDLHHLTGFVERVAVRAK
jgi:Mitochondrial K+-H+ exchange-related